jgi:hypothetical protein
VVYETFSVVPSSYYQLYTISFLKNNNLFPVVFAILKNKTFITYTRMWQNLKSLVGNLEPNVIKTDFEKASINALKTHFPNTEVSGCMFHLGQA